MRFGVVVFPGTWSDCDFHYVISEVLHEPVKYVWHRERNLEGLECVILPGGFSYGDYLRAGAIAGRSLPAALLVMGAALLAAGLLSRVSDADLRGQGA